MWYLGFHLAKIMLPFGFGPYSLLNFGHNFVGRSVTFKIKLCGDEDL